MVKQWFVVALGSLLLASCGGGPVRLVSPADGQTFQMSQSMGGTQGFQVQSFIAQTDDNEYNDVSIVAKGAEAVPGLQCSGGQLVYLQCFLYPAQNMQSFGYQRFTVVVEATRGDYKDVRVVHFVQGQPQATQPPR